MIINSPKYGPKKRKSKPKKKTVDTVKRTKKVKLKGQNSCFNSVDNLYRHLNKKKGLKKRK